MISVARQFLFALMSACIAVGSPAAVVVDEDAWTQAAVRNAVDNPHASFDTTASAFFPFVPLLAEDNNNNNNNIDTIITPQFSRTEIDTLLQSLGKEEPSIDWRTKGAVTAVKNQGAFGTCWSFAAAENLEGLNVRQGNVLQNISNQELIDCCADCQGRAASASFDFLLNNTDGRIVTQSAYPYKGNVSHCAVHEGAKKNSTVRLHTYGRIQDDGTGDPIVAGLVKYGPMGLGVDANCFFGYKSGVITNCTKSAIDHAVLMVGAGHDSETKVDYYIIKNSWGANWGENGYVRVARGTPAQAGIGSTVWTL